MLEESEKSLSEVQDAITEFQTWKLRKRMFRVNVIDELKRLQALRNDKLSIRSELRVARVKVVRCADQIDVLTSEVNHLRRLKHKEHKKCQQIDQALIKLPDLPPEPPVRSRRHCSPDAVSSTSLTDLTTRIQGLRDRLDGRPITVVSREPPAPERNPMETLARQLLDLMARIKLEKSRWTANLHVTSIQLLANSWSKQLNDLCPDLAA
jgi:hypothetical protein